MIRKYIIKINIFLFLLIFTGNILAQNSNPIQSSKTEMIDQIKNLRIIGHTVKHKMVKFNCLYGTDNQKAAIIISFPYADAVRVQLHQDENVFQDDSGAVFETQETENGYRLKTDSLVVQIQKQPWQIKVQRIDGSIVFSQLGTESGYYNTSIGNKGIRIAAESQEGEGFFGFGEKFNGMNQRGRKVVMKIDDAYVERGDRAYKSIPFFISSARYGLLVNTGLPVVFHLGDQSDKFFSFECPDNSVDFYIFANRNPLEIIRQYTDITGKSSLIPKWALEPWLSRRSMTGWNNTVTVDADIHMYLKAGFPLGVILWEGIRGQFNKKQTPDLHVLSDKWHALGIKQVFWSLTGHLGENSEIIKKVKPEFFIRNNDSSFAIGGFKGGHIYLDPTNSAAMEWWERTQYEPYVSDLNGRSASGHANLDGVKIDFCELFPQYRSSLLMKKPVKGIENLHAVLFSEQIFNWLQQIKPEGGITWVRGGGLGIQRAGYVWGGDRRRTFAQFRASVSASLSLSVCGVALSGYDLGGYIGGDSPDSREVYIRGAQYSAFSPSFHDHGSAPAPWEQNEYGRENYKYYTRLRYNLMPYLYHLVRIAHTEGFPLMRPLFLHYPEDKETYAIEDEYLLGDALLVAPFVYSGTTRQIYLPQGQWIDFRTGETFSGHRFISYTAPLNRIPVFVKNSAIIPMELNNALQIGGAFSQREKNDLLLTFAIFGDRDNHFTFYDKDVKTAVSFHPNGDEKINNINHNFGLLLFAGEPNEIHVNKEKLSYLSIDNFIKSTKNSWTYDPEKLRILLKVEVTSIKKDYTVRIAGINDKEYLRKLKQRRDHLAVVPKAPQIIKVEKWQETADIYFNKADKAFNYIIDFGYAPDSLENRVKNVYESPVTIGNLVSGKPLYVKLSAQNEWGVSDINTPFTAKIVNFKNAVFSLKNNAGFLRANHFNQQDVSDEGAKSFVYSVSVPDSGNFHLWIKAKKNIGHHKYFRWYYGDDIKFKKGINAIRLIVENPRTEIEAFYLTSSKKDRPIMKRETEMKYFMESLTPAADKITVKF